MNKPLLALAFLLLVSSSPARALEENRNSESTSITPHKGDIVLVGTKATIHSGDVLQRNALTITILPPGTELAPELCTSLKQCIGKIAVRDMGCGQTISVNNLEDPAMPILKSKVVKSISRVGAGEFVPPTAVKLIETKVPPQKTPNNWLSALDDVVGRKTKRSIPAGSIITEKYFGPRGTLLHPEPIQCYDAEGKPIKLSKDAPVLQDQLIIPKSDEPKQQHNVVHYDDNILIDAPETPQIIEFFDSKSGPSSLLLEKRLLGVKVLSLPLDARSTRDKLKVLNLPKKPQVVSLNAKEHLLLPFPISNDWRANRELFYEIEYKLPEPGEFAAPTPRILSQPNQQVPALTTEQEMTLQNKQFDGWPKIVHTGLARLMFDGRGGHLGPSIVPLTPVAHTWFYQNQNNFKSLEGTNLNKNLRALVRETVEALNSDLLDTKRASSKLVGEARLTGTSIKAGCETHPGLGRFSKLKKNQIFVRQLSGNCAVARIAHKKHDTESYFYLIDENGWKVSAIRTPLEEKKFAPGLDLDEPSHDENWNRREAEMVRNLTQAQKGMNNVFHDARVQATKRSLMTDGEIRRWFKQHQAELNEVANQAMSELEVGYYQAAIVFFSLDVGFGDTTSSLSSRLRSLELGTAQKLKDKNVYLKFSSGRYSESGILFSEDDCPPPIGPYGTIWTEKLANHWYLMRVIDDLQFPATLTEQKPNPARMLLPRK